jgi:Kdo2-lipid IVA lauroyltransferase/acyltransferase
VNLRRARKSLKRYVVYLLVRLLAGAWSCLPISIALAVGRSLGRVALWFASKDRQRAAHQLQERMGLPADEARRVVARMAAHLGTLAAEIILLPRLVRDLDRHVVMDDDARRVIEEAAAEGKGVILITGHLGNWELLAQRIVVSGFDGSTVVRSNPNPYLSDWLIRRRRVAGLEVLDRDHPVAARKLLKALSRGAVVGFLIDQDTRVSSVFVPFFGRPAATPVVPAKLALRRRAPVVTAFIERTRHGHRVRAERLSLDDIPGDDLEARATALTARMTLAIEDAVRARPHEWVWFHRRWRRRPGA